jgi:catechol-2,3-dioxygenase
MEPGAYHGAITVPEDRFAEAKAWLQERVPLLERDGLDEFALGVPWNSQSVYFEGPDGILLELIERRDGAAAIDVTWGFRDDEAWWEVPAGLLAAQSITNLTTQEEQTQTFHNVAEQLQPGGCFVIENYIPELPRLRPGRPPVHRDFYPCGL